MTDYDKIQHAAEKADELWIALHDISGFRTDFNNILNEHGIEDEWLDDIFCENYEPLCEKYDDSYLMKIRCFISDLIFKLRDCKKPLIEKNNALINWKIN